MTDTSSLPATTDSETLTEDKSRALAVVSGGASAMEKMLFLATQAGAENMRAAHEIYEKEKKSACELKFQEAFSAAQAAFPEIKKNKTAKVNLSTGGTMKYSYADLANVINATRPPLTSNGLSIRTYTGESNLPGHYRAVCAISGFGHTVESYFDIPDGSGDKNTMVNGAQKAGIARTYAVRYAVYNALGIFPSDEDTDANAPEDSGDSAATTTGGSGKKAASASSSPKEPCDATNEEIDKMVRQFAAVREYAESDIHINEEACLKISQRPEFTTMTAAAFKKRFPNEGFALNDFQTSFIRDFGEKFAPGRKFQPSKRQWESATRIWDELGPATVAIRNELGAGASTPPPPPPSAAKAATSGGGDNFSDMDEVPF